MTDNPQPVVSLRWSVYASIEHAPNDARSAYSETIAQGYGDSPAAAKRSLVAALDQQAAAADTQATAVRTLVNHARAIVEED